MIHDYSEVFDTDNELWQRVLEIYAKNEKYEKKIVSGRNLHHKFPRSFSKKLGEPVDNDKDNLISLSLADHFLVHYYYYKLAKKGYRQSMATAFTFMAKKGLKYMTPETAETMARDYAEALDIRPTRKAAIVSEETRKKISLAKKGSTHSEYTRKMMSIHRKGKRPNNTGKPFSIFGNKFKEHYNMTKVDNPNLYNKEYTYYVNHNHVCSWEIID